MVDPTKLEASARRLYGDAFDELWGELVPVPAENVHIVGDEVVGLDCFPTPGHAWHHVSYLDGSGTLYAGDAAGVRVGRRRVRDAAVPSAGVRPRGVGADDPRDRAARARPARPHPFRGRTRTSRRTSPSCARPSRAGPTGSRTAWTSRRSSPPRVTTCPRRTRSWPTPTTGPRPYWHHFRGIERYWRKRGEAAAADSA